MQSITKTQLSERDRMVLDSIFNPTGGGSVDEIYTSTSEDTDLCDEDELNTDTEEYKECARLELDAIRAAEDKEYEKGLLLLNESISKFPGRASTWNNRAQVHRFLKNDEGRS
jgi:hypothetical protein